MRIARSIRQFFVRTYKSMVGVFQSWSPDTQKGEFAALDTSAHILAAAPPPIDQKVLDQLTKQAEVQYQGALPILLSFSLQGMDIGTEPRIFLFRQKKRTYIAPVPLIAGDFDLDNWEQVESPEQMTAQDTVAIPVPSKSGAVIQKGAVYQFYDRKFEPSGPIAPTPPQESMMSLAVTPTTPTSPTSPISPISIQTSQSDPVISLTPDTPPLQSLPLTPDLESGTILPAPLPSTRRKSLRKIASDIAKSLSVVNEIQPVHPLPLEGDRITTSSTDSPFPNRLNRRRSTMLDIRGLSTGQWASSWTEMGCTETKAFEAQPQFQRPIQILVAGGGISPIYRVLVVDMVNPAQKGQAAWGGQRFLGYVDLNIGSVIFGALLSHGRQFALKTTAPPPDFAPFLKTKIRKFSSTPLVVIRPTAIPPPAARNNAIVKLYIGAEHIEKRDVFGHSDAYMCVSRAISNDLTPSAVKTWIPVYKSEVVDREENPVWQPFSLGLDQLCQGNLDKLLRFELWDYDNVKPHDMIGYCHATLRRIEGSGHLSDLVIPRKENRRGYTNSGVLVFKSVEIVGRDIHFVDFLATGTQLGFCVAMDFTSGNGIISDPNSAHWYNPNRDLANLNSLNRTEKALISLTSFVEPYSEDHKIPFYGFGARMPTTVGFRTSHCFAVNGDDSNPVCDYGTYGVLGTYHQFLPTVEMSRPIMLSEVLKTIKEGLQNIESMGNADKKLKQYTIVLLFMDSAPIDMAETLVELDQLQNLPCTIVITCMSRDRARQERFRAVEEMLKNPSDYVGKPLNLRQPTTSLTGIVNPTGPINVDDIETASNNGKEDNFYFGGAQIRRNFLVSGVYADYEGSNFFSYADLMMNKVTTHGLEYVQAKNLLPVSPKA